MGGNIITLRSEEGMNMKTHCFFKPIVKMSAFLLAFVVVASLSRAADLTLPLSPDKTGKGASGEISIKDTNTGQKEITITVRGLKPEGVYTVWFVNMKPKMDMAGIGAPDHVIRIDDKGSGTYHATVSAAELEKWQMIEIAYHKTGDPKDMKHMTGALKGGLISRGMKGMGM
jgi:hypothetical protein